jgi:hypothetical protein
MFMRAKHGLIHLTVCRIPVLMVAISGYANSPAIPKTNPAVLASVSEKRQL